MRKAKVERNNKVKKVERKQRRSREVVDITEVIS